MKSRAALLPLLAAVVCSALSGCEKWTVCQSGLPISWDDYNSVETVNRYFYCDDSMNVHNGDTLKITGYIDESFAELGTGDAASFIYLADKIYAFPSSADHSELCVDKAGRPGPTVAHRGKRLYVICKKNVYQPGYPGVDFNLIAFDTIRI